MARSFGNPVMRDELEAIYSSEMFRRFADAKIKLTHLYEWFVLTFCFIFVGLHLVSAEEYEYLRTSRTSSRAPDVRADTHKR